MHPFFDFLGFAVSTYWLCAGLGCVAALGYLFAANHRGKRGRLAPKALLHICLGAGACALLGAALYYSVYILSYLMRRPEALQRELPLLLRAVFGGFGFYGGLLGALLFLYIYCRRQGLSYKTAANILVPAIPLFHGFWKVGCFFGGCCWGVASPGGVVFPNAAPAPDGIALLPVQLYEAAFDLLLFAFLLWAAGRLPATTALLPLYLVPYAVFRFCIGFTRGDVLPGAKPPDLNQWVSLGILVVVSCLYLIPRKKTIRPE